MPSVAELKLPPRLSAPPLAASVPLLRHVSGLNQMVARDVIEFRKQQGGFKTREQLLQVANIGPARYVQAAGFLKIRDGENPLDQTWIHPESYAAAQQLLGDLGIGPEALADPPKLEELRAGIVAFRKSGKPVLLFQMMGKLDDLFC